MRKYRDPREKKRRDLSRSIRPCRYGDGGSRPKIARKQAKMACRFWDDEEAMEAVWDAEKLEKVSGRWGKRQPYPSGGLWKYQGRVLARSNEALLKSGIDECDAYTNDWLTSRLDRSKLDELLGMPLQHRFSRHYTFSAHSLRQILIQGNVGRFYRDRASKKQQRKQLDALLKDKQKSFRLIQLLVENRFFESEDYRSCYFTWMTPSLETGPATIVTLDQGKTACVTRRDKSECIRAHIWEPFNKKNHKRWFEEAWAAYRKPKLLKYTNTQLHEVEVLKPVSPKILQKYREQMYRFGYSSEDIRTQIILSMPPDELRKLIGTHYGNPTHSNILKTIFSKALANSSFQHLISEVLDT